MCFPIWVEVQSLLEQARSMQEIAAKNLYDCKLYGHDIVFPYADREEITVGKPSNVLQWRQDHSYMRYSKCIYHWCASSTPLLFMIGMRR